MYDSQSDFQRDILAILNAMNHSQSGFRTNILALLKAMYDSQSDFQREVLATLKPLTKRIERVEKVVFPSPTPIDPDVNYPSSLREEFDVLRHQIKRLDEKFSKELDGVYKTVAEKEKDATLESDTKGVVEYAGRNTE